MSLVPWLSSLLTAQEDVPLRRDPLPLIRGEGILARAGAEDAAGQGDAGPGDGEENGPCAGPGPCIAALRAIQRDFSEVGGTVVCLWTIAPGVFNEIAIRVDDRQEHVFGGDTPGVNLGRLPLGPHRITVEGRRSERVSRASIEIVVLASSPVPPVRISRWLTYGFGAPPSEGLLDLEWEVAGGGGNEPYEDYEIWVDGRFQGVLPGDRTSLSLGGISPDPHRLEILPFSREYSAIRPEILLFSARPVTAPVEPACRVIDCDDGAQTLEIAFGWPPLEKLDAVAVWILEEGRSKWVFLGYHEPPSDLEPGERIALVIDDMPVLNLRIEVAAALTVEGIEEPVHFSNLPKGPGDHATARCFFDPENCLPRSEALFRRGDVQGDGRFDISDPILLLFHLFLGEWKPSCEDALDADDDGYASITDAIRLLEHMFLGNRPPPAAPGPHSCGVDRTPDRFSECDYPGCRP